MDSMDSTKRAVLYIWGKKGDNAETLRRGMALVPSPHRRYMGRAKGW